MELDGHTKVMLQNFRPAPPYYLIRESKGKLNKKEAKRLDEEITRLYKDRLNLLREIGEQIAEKYPQEIAALDRPTEALSPVVVINDLRRWTQVKLAKTINPKSALKLKTLKPAISITANREHIELPRGRVLPLSVFIRTEDTSSRMSRDPKLDLRLLAAYDQAVRTGDVRPNLTKIVERFMKADPEFSGLRSKARTNKNNSLRQRLGRVLKSMGRR